MKKLVLILILTIGFFYEGKAQIAPSSEIHYYLKVENSNSREIELIKFESQDKVICYSASYFPELADYFETSLSDKEQKLNNYRQEQFKFIWYYSPQESTAKYCTYRFYKGGLERLSISKDKETLIRWTVPGEYGYQYRYYYKRISRSDLLNLAKPNIDFLE